MRLTTQFFRYAAVGLATNALAFLGYLALTQLGVGPKLAMSLMYALGTVQAFLLNKRWSFAFEGNATRALGRYICAYAAGYVLNWLGLMLLVDHYGLPHAPVQALMIVLVAMLLFAAQRYWVFVSTRKQVI